MQAEVKTAYSMHSVRDWEEFHGMIARGGFGEDLMARVGEGEALPGEIGRVKVDVLGVHCEFVDAVAEFGREAEEAGGLLVAAGTGVEVSFLK